MLKQQGLLEVTKGENTYQLHLPAGASCPLGEVHDVLHEMKSFIVNMIVQSNQPPQPAQSVPEGVKPEEQNGQQYSQV
jgi:hypothetical protein